MADDKFKLPNSSYEELTKIVKSYGHFIAPAGLDEVSKLIGMDKTVISRNAGFLIELDLLETGQKKALSSTGRELSQALQHEKPEEIRRCWRKIVNENGFISKLVAAIKIRNGMDESTLQSHIAYSAGQPKKPQFMTGARTIIDILRAAELIKESDGKFVVSTIESTESGSSANNSRKPLSTTNESSVSPPTSITTSPIKTGDSPIKINVNINISCSVPELDDLGEKLRKVIEEVKSGDASLEISSDNQ